MLKHIIILAIALLINNLSICQTIILNDGFDNIDFTSNWNAKGKSVTVSNIDKSLKVDFSRPEGQGDHESYIYKEVSYKNISNYQLAFDVKSDSAIHISVNLIFDDGSMSRDNAETNGNSELKRVEFSGIFFATRNISQINLNMRGGRRGVKKAVMYIDNLILTTKNEVDTSFFSKIIEKARIYYQNAIEGNADGQFKPGSKEQFKSAIELATKSLRSNDWKWAK